MSYRKKVVQISAAFFREIKASSKKKKRNKVFPDF